MREHKSISIADQIFEQLERDILTGRYPRGEVLSEMRLSTELGVSRTPIREAIRRLEQEHILEESGRGMVVVGISREDMLDMSEIRVRIEGRAAARAAPPPGGRPLRRPPAGGAAARPFPRHRSAGTCRRPLRRPSKSAILQ